jgi:hypothetical protein
MSDYKDTRKEIKQANRAAETAENQQNELSEFFARHNELCNNKANKNICLQYFAGDELTLEALEESYAGHPRFREMLCAFESEKELRESLQEKIVELLRNGTSPDNIRAAQSAFRYKSIENLRANLEELERRAEFRTKTTQELRDIIKRPKPGFKELPAMYRNSRSMILTLPPAELRRFIAVYGSDNVNKALNTKE